MDRRGRLTTHSVVDQLTRAHFKLAHSAPAARPAFDVPVALRSAGGGRKGEAGRTLLAAASAFGVARGVAARGLVLVFGAHGAVRTHRGVGGVAGAQGVLFVFFTGLALNTLRERER